MYYLENDQICFWQTLTAGHYVKDKKKRKGKLIKGINYKTHHKRETD